MNRLSDLSQTLPKNIQDNVDYPNAEFILLDYNSTDGLEEWAYDTMREHLDSGRLRYCRTEASRFCPNHSRNVSFRLAKGELVTNVDADNFTHAGFLYRLNQCASVADHSLLIVPEDFLLPDSNRLLLRGRFALYKKDIELLHGFDETLDGGFSHDDVNFVFRMMMARFRIVRFETRYVEGRIPTSDLDRRRNMCSDRSFEQMKIVNEYLTQLVLSRGRITVNPSGWGKAIVREVSGSTQHWIQT